MTSRRDMPRGRPTEHDAACLALLREAAEADLPCPSSFEIAAALEVGENSPIRMVARLERQGLLRVERRNRSQRRIVFPDGARTRYTAITGMAISGRRRRYVESRLSVEPPPIPPDTRDLTGRLCGDPVVQREHEVWTPVYETASVTLPKLSFLDGASA